MQAHVRSWNSLCDSQFHGGGRKRKERCWWVQDKTTHGASELRLDARQKDLPSRGQEPAAV